MPSMPKKSASESVSAWGRKTVRLRCPPETRYTKMRHEATLLGSLVVAIAALGSYIVTTTVAALPTYIPLGHPSVCLYKAAESSSAR